MIGRLLVGLIVGALTGVLLAIVLLKGLGVTIFTGALLAYAFAALTGILTGLVAGKPIWASGGQIEAGLKAVFGALLAAAGMFAIRKWLTMDVDLSKFGVIGQAGLLPATALPLIGGVLGAFYELDNTEDGEKKGTPAKAKAPAKKVRVSAKDEAGAVEEDADDEASASPAKGKKKA